MTPPRPLIVLLAEDDTDSREMYSQFLELAGCRVEQARDGKEALEMARRLVPDVLVTDLTLPGLDGLELAAGLRRDARTANVPIIVVSGSTSPDLDRRMSSARVTSSLLKPCLPEDLLKEIQRATGRA